MAAASDRQGMPGVWDIRGSWTRPPLLPPRQTAMPQRASRCLPGAATEHPQRNSRPGRPAPMPRAGGTLCPCRGVLRGAPSMLDAQRAMEAPQAAQLRSARHPCARRWLSKTLLVKPARMRRASDERRLMTLLTKHKRFLVLLSQGLPCRPPPAGTPPGGHRVSPLHIHWLDAPISPFFSGLKAIVRTYTCCSRFKRPLCKQSGSSSGVRWPS